MFRSAALSFSIIALAVVLSAPAGGQATDSPASSVEIDAQGERPPAATDFVDCMTGEDRDISSCSMRVAAARHRLLERCLDRNSTESPQVIIQACTECITQQILQLKGEAYEFVNRADAYFRLGLVRRALEDYDKAIHISPHTAALYYNRGVYYAEQGEIADARADFDSALRLDRKLVAALHSRARLEESQDNFAGALADYTEAIRLEPKTASLWRDRGYVQLRRFKNMDAIEDESTAISLDPNTGSAFLFRGVAYQRLNDRRAAERDIGVALRLDPALGKYLNGN